MQSCAEKETIFLERGEIELKKEYFEYQTLAKDELFKCIECGNCEDVCPQHIQIIEELKKAKDLFE